MRQAAYRKDHLFEVDSGGRSNSVVGRIEYDEVCKHVSVDVSAQFPTAQHSLVPNLPANIVSMTGKTGLWPSHGGAIWSEDEIISWEDHY